MFTFVLYAFALDRCVSFRCDQYHVHWLYALVLTIMFVFLVVMTLG